MEFNKNMLELSINKLEKWIEDNDYKGYEPFDGLSSWLKPLTFHSLFLERILQQTVRQFPINLRPLLGVKKKDSTKGRGYIAWGYLEMFKKTGMEIYKKKTEECLNWLMENKSPLYSDYSWGNHFNYSSRSGRIPIYEPTIVWTSLIGHVFLDAYDIFKNEKYLAVSDSIAKWILNLSREKTSTGDCFSYVAYEESYIHNSNMLGSSFLARLNKIRNNPEIANIAKSAMEYSCSRQMKDGSWYYGEAEKYHWVDNFHTGYHLDSLKCYIDYSGDIAYQKNLNIGLKYYKENFFEDDGTPKYYNTRKYPIDIQCASQAITTLVYFSDIDEECLELSKKVANWTINNMQDRDGYFYYRIYPLFTAKAPMIHWGQATMYKALTSLLGKL